MLISSNLIVGLRLASLIKPHGDPYVSICMYVNYSSKEGRKSLKTSLHGETRSSFFWNSMRIHYKNENIKALLVN
jgi:hypothetical protein